MPLNNDSTYEEVERELVELEKRVEEKIKEMRDPSCSEEEREKKVEEFRELHVALALAKLQKIKVAPAGTVMSFALNPTHFGSEKVTYDDGDVTSQDANNNVGMLNPGQLDEKTVVIHTPPQEKAAEPEPEIPPSYTPTRTASLKQEEKLSSSEGNTEPEDLSASPKRSAQQPS